MFGFLLGFFFFSSDEDKGYGLMLRGIVSGKPDGLMAALAQGKAISLKNIVLLCFNNQASEIKMKKRVS